MQVHIPATIEEAAESLNGIGRLLNATKWERAAIVAAYVQPDQPPGPKGDGRESAYLTPKEFGKLGIISLKNHETVARYANAWLAVRKRPEPGGTVDLDGLPAWREDSEGSRNVKEPERIEAIEAQAEADNTGKNMAVKIAGNAAAMAAAIKADPATADAAAAALREIDFPMATEEDEAHWYWEEENKREKGYYDGGGSFEPDPNHGELAREMERSRREREARERERHGSVVLVLNVLAEMLASGRRELAKIEGRTFTWDADSRAALADLAAKVHVLEVRVATMPDSEPLTSEAIYEGLGMN